MSEPDVLHRFEFTFDRDFIHLGLRRAMWRAVLFGTLAMALVGVLLSMVTRRPGGYVLAVCCAGIVAIAVALVIKFRRAGGLIYELWRTQSPDHTLRYELGYEGFTVRTNKGSSEYAWDAVRSFRRKPRIWHIEVSRGVSVFFPPQAVPLEAQEFIVQRCERTAPAT